jgi:hypothetical protein
MDSQQAAQAIGQRAAERFERVDRYLDRVAALTPADWGRLDAIGARQQGNDPLTRWRRARRFATEDSVFAWMEWPATFTHLGLEVVGNIVHALDGDEAFARLLRRLFPPDGQPRSPEAERMGAQMLRLREIAGAQPGGAGTATSVLMTGLLALHRGAHQAPANIARMYSLVEPVIPFASL